MAETNSNSEHGEHVSHVSMLQYASIAVALAVLTSASFFTNSDMWPFQGEDVKWVGRTFMMVVSCTKAMLVILFFMHVKFEKGWKYVLTIPTMIMACFLVLMLVPDIGRRVRHYSEQRKLFAAEPSDADSGDADSNDKQEKKH